MDASLTDLARTLAEEPTRSLWNRLGKELIAADRAAIPMHDIFGARRDDAAYIAVAVDWTSRTHDDIYQIVCIKFGFCAKKKSLRLDERIELIATLGGLLGGLVGHVVTGVVLATILLRQGSSSFCECESAKPYLDEALN